MNKDATVRITIEKRSGGKTIERHVFSLAKPPYQARNFMLRYGGRRSKKYETVTVTELSKKFSKWIAGMINETNQVKENH